MAHLHLLHLLLGHDAGQVMAEATQQTAGALAPQEVEADAPLLTVHLWRVTDRLICDEHSMCAGHAELNVNVQLLQSHSKPNLCTWRTCTMWARSCEYLHESPRMHVPLVKSKQICRLASGSGCPGRPIGRNGFRWCPVRMSQAAAIAK